MPESVIVRKKVRSLFKRDYTAWNPLSPVLNLTFTFLLVVCFTASNLRASELAIVIDDVGYNLNRAERILALPVELTLGMLPFAPHAQLIAERAHESGREIILHQPMEPIITRRLEPGTLQASMSAENFEAQFAESLARLPQAAGVNNHTGSLLTTQRLPMEWLMSNIAKRGLYFLDSRTTPHTVAESTARDWAVPTIRRDVFLDHVRSNASLEAAFERSLKIARRQGHAVVIAHPHAMTLDFLEQRLGELPEDVRLTTLRNLVEPVRPLDRTTLVLYGNPASPNISLGQ